MTRVTLETLLDRSVRNMGAVHSVVKESTVEIIRRAYALGINVQISAGLRDNAEQARLYNQGRTTPGNIVTNARAGYSNHNFGLAVDYFLVSNDGTVGHWDITRDMNASGVADWLEVANIAKSLGFAWGGDWTSFRDYPHIEMTGGLSTAQLRAGKRPNLVSKVKNPLQVVTRPAIPQVKPSKTNTNEQGLAARYVGPVYNFQNWLKANYGFDIELDNAYGPLTHRAAVKALQIELNKQYNAKLVVDGLPGPATRKAYRVVKRGDTGNIVRVIQGILMSKEYDIKGFDGMFGSGLEAAVKAYQKANKLTADGIVGPMTWNALLK